MQSPKPIPNLLPTFKTKNPQRRQQSTLGGEIITSLQPFKKSTDNLIIKIRHALIRAGVPLRSLGKHPSSLDTGRD